MKDANGGCAKHWSQCTSCWGEQDYGQSHCQYPTCWQEMRALRTTQFTQMPHCSGWRSLTGARSDKSWMPLSMPVSVPPVYQIPFSRVYKLGKAQKVIHWHHWASLQAHTGFALRDTFDPLFYPMWLLSDVALWALGPYPRCLGPIRMDSACLHQARHGPSFSAHLFSVHQG